MSDKQICNVRESPPPETLEGVQEDMGGQVLFPLQQLHTLQCHPHGRPVFGTLTTHVTQAIQLTTHLQG